MKGKEMVAIINKTRKYKINKSRIVKLINFIKTKTDIKKANLSIVFCGERFIRNYNKKYRNKDSSTDVLSFPSGEQTYLGDIIISIPNVFKNSIREKVPYKEELYRVIIHGFLHLIGYEHQDENSLMIRFQEKLLKEFIDKHD